MHPAAAPPEAGPHDRAVPVALRMSERKMYSGVSAYHQSFMLAMLASLTSAPPSTAGAWREMKSEVASSSSMLT